jgi:ATP-dependent DNA helicase HFM1/MER3
MFNDLKNSLHHELIEHLNVEIVLKTIVDLSSAITWLKSTFLYTRLMKNPTYYGITIEKARFFDERIQEYLRNLCIRNLSSLMQCDLIENCDFISDPNAQLIANANGHLLAKYSLSFKTMESIIREVKYRQVENAHLLADERKTVQQPSKSLPDLVRKIFAFRSYGLHVNLFCVFARLR